MNRQETVLSRRQMLKLLSLGAGGALLAACAPATPAAPPATEAPTAPPPTEAPTAPPPTEAPTPTPEPTPTTGPRVNSVGKVLPDDAAPPEQQVYVTAGQGNPGQFMDISAMVYNRGALSDLYGVPLTRINKDFELVPGAAKEWKVSEDGLTWTFTLRDDIMWSDDTPLTADDFVATFRYMADPKSAYDFTWYYSKGSGNIKNFDEVVAGKLPVEELGVRKGANDYELIVETGEVTPYLPRLFMFAMPLQAKALAAHGPAYNSNPATCVSCGPFIVKEFSPTRVEVVANPKAADDIKPFLERMIAVPFPDSFQAYQAGQLDFTGVSNAAQVDAVLNDPQLSAQATPDVGDFRTDYFFFDVTKPPFDNLKFRQALSHLLDRESIVKFITKPLLARPAYSFLAPGFPAANGEALKDIQRYDPELAKKLYAESGVKVDKLLLQMRGDLEGYFGKEITQAYADSIKQNLGIEVEVKSVPIKDYMADLLKRTPDGKPDTTIDFGYISYGMDYLDPSNMLTVMKGSDLGGRHTWNNKEYQDLLAKAGPMTDIEERTKLYQQAEKLMVEECAFIFCIHRTPVNLWKPYIKGAPMEPGKVNLNRGVAWPGVSAMNGAASEIYIANNVLEFRKSIP
ncbi:MAG: peptide ABC transporter substrate-binding protein [Thermoflexales bacterium]|nr:peptide ABC transporter substrate-binding protein [Thermoflexales bacterium]